MIRGTSIVAALAGTLLFGACAGAPTPEQDASALAEEGAEIWQMTCNRCHNLRTPDEFAAEQWPVIIDHMRTRADLTRSEARAVATFMRDRAEAAEGR